LDPEVGIRSERCLRGETIVYQPDFRIHFAIILSMFGAEASEFPVFLYQHIIVIKQAIPSLMAGFIRHRVIKLGAIVGRVLGGMAPVLPIIIQRTKVVATHVRDDVIITVVRVGILEQLVVIVETGRRLPGQQA